MSVSSSDIVFSRSANSGSSGGGIGGGVITDNVKNNLFDDIIDSERIAGGTRYKKWFISNQNSTESFEKPVVWISTGPRNMGDAIGLGWNSTDDADPLQGNIIAIGTSGQLVLASSGTDTRTITLVGITAAGNPETENIALTGATPVTTVKSWGTLYAAKATAVHAVTVSIFETGGTRLIGTIDLNKICAWRWMSPASFAGGFRLPTMGPETYWGFWERITWAASIDGARPNYSNISVQEDF
jgi:hypothetical protein